MDKLKTSFCQLIASNVPYKASAALYLYSLSISNQCVIGTLYLTGVLLASPTMHLSSPHSSLRTFSRMLGSKLEIVQKTHWYLVIVIGNMYAEYSLDKYTV